MYCPNCGAKIEEDAKFCTNCGHQVGAPMTSGAAADQAANQGAKPAQKPAIDFSKPLIDSDKLPEKIRNMPSYQFNSLAFWGAIVGLVLGVISLVFLIKVDTDLGYLPLILETEGGSIAIYIVFLLLFIAGLILTAGTEILGGIHFARKADYKGLPAVLIANLVEFIMMFFMIPTLNFFSKVSSAMIHGASAYSSNDLWGMAEALYDGLSSVKSIPTIAAGIVMIIISAAVIIVIANFAELKPAAAKASEPETVTAEVVAPEEDSSDSSEI